MSRTKDLAALKELNEFPNGSKGQAKRYKLLMEKLRINPDAPKDKRHALREQFDWVAAAQGDPNVELQVTPFAPGLSELAGLRWDIEAAGNRQNSWVDDYPYGNLLDSDPYENWGGSDPYDRIADDLTDYWNYDACTCDNRGESQQRHEDEYRDPWFPLRTIDPHYYWVQPDQWYEEKTWHSSEEPDECQRERWSGEGILLHRNLPKSRIHRAYAAA